MGLLVITKTDVMEPELAAEEALERLRGTSLGEPPWLGVSARTGEGIDKLRNALDDLVARLPPSDPAAPVRLWVDRGFTIHGAGLVVTGTLAAGTVRTGDTLELAGSQKRYVVREMQSLNEHVTEASGVARVALNLRGAHRGEIRRGDALMTPGTYRSTAVTGHPHPPMLPGRSARRPAGPRRCRDGRRPPAPAGPRHRPPDAERVPCPCAPGTGWCCALPPGSPVVPSCSTPTRHAWAAAAPPVPARSPSTTTPTCPIPPPSSAAAASSARNPCVSWVSRPPVEPLAADWLVDPSLVSVLRERLAALTSGDPLKVEDARKALELPDARLVAPLLGPGLEIRDGTIVPAGATDTLTPAVRQALSDAGGALARLRRLRRAALAAAGLGPAEIAAAVRNGRMVRLAPDVVAARHRARGGAYRRSPHCRSRSRSARPAKPCTPTEKSSCHCWSTWR